MHLYYLLFAFLFSTALAKVIYSGKKPYYLDEDMMMVDDPEDDTTPEETPSERQIAIRRVTAQRTFLPGMGFGGFGYGGLGYGGLGYGGLGYGGLGYGGLYGGYGGLGYGGLGYGRVFDEGQEKTDDTNEDEGDDMEIGRDNFIRIPGSVIEKLILKMKESEEREAGMEHQGGAMGIPDGDLTEVPQVSKSTDRFNFLRKEQTDKKVITVPHHIFRRLMRKVSKYDSKFNRNVKVIKVPHELFETLQQRPQRERKIILVRPSRMETTFDEQ
jgi:hypothetical protein